MRLVILTSVFLTTMVGIALAESEVVRFPGNPGYGYVVEVDPTSPTGRTYHVLRVTGDADTPGVVLRSVQRGLRLCAPEVASYLATDGDSTRLVTFSLTDPNDVDTIVSFSATLPSVHIWPRPDNSKITGLASYFFSLRDSLLVWSSANPRFSPIQIGTIEANGDYLYKMGWGDGSIGSPTLDFGEILLVESYRAPNNRGYRNGGSIILSYDLVDHSLAVVDSVSSGCSAVSRRFPGDTVWCLAYTGEMDQNLCRIEDGQLVNVTEVHHPLRIADYRLYRDHIEIDTIRCGGDGLGPKN